MSKPETIKIDEVEYVRADSVHIKCDPSKIKIVVLQRGWVAVGEFYQKGTECRLENASIVRRWGTTKGLGELAEKGPLNNTTLDPCNTLRFHELTIVCTFDVNVGKWS